MNRLYLQWNFSLEISLLSDILKKTDVGVFKKKQVVNTIGNLKKAIEMLDKEICDGYILNRSKIIKLINDKRLKDYTYQFIEKFNNGEFSNLNERVCFKIRNHLNEYYKIFDKYKIGRRSLDENILNKYDLHELDLLFNFLVNKHKLSSFSAYNILMCSSYERIFSVFNVISKYRFNNDDIFDFDNFLYNLCDINSNYFDNFVSNTSLLSTYNLLPEFNSYFLGYICSNSELLKKNIDILISYDLLDKIRDVGNYYIIFDILFIDDLANEIDNILEMGCFDFLKENISTLECCNSKRLQYLKCIGMPAVDQESYDVTMTSNKFFVDDGELDLEISTAALFSKNDYLNIGINDLEKFRLEEDKNLYLIGGVLVSYNKVNRLYEAGNSIYKSIVSGLVLSDDEYDSLMNALRALQYKKNKTN